MSDYINNFVYKPTGTYTGSGSVNTIWAGQGMPIGYLENFDFSAVTWINWNTLAFNYMQMPMPGSVIFSSSQFGPGLISPSLTVYGAIGTTTISVNINTNVFDASQWTFIKNDPLNYNWVGTATDPASPYYPEPESDRGLVANGVGLGATIIGTSEWDDFHITTGNANVNGLEGNNSAYFSSPKSSYSISSSNNIIYVSNGDGFSNLTNISKIIFSDQTVNTSSIVNYINPVSDGQFNDLNGNGTADLFWKNGSSFISLFTSNSGSYGGLSSLAEPGAGYVYADYGQINGTGVFEPIWNKEGVGIALGFLNGSDQSYSLKYVAAPTGAGWTYWQAADMSGDGRSDMVWKYGENLGVSLLQTNGDKIGDYWYGSPGGDWRAVDIVKINGDNRYDVFWTSASLDGALASTITDDSGTGIASSNWLSKPGAGWTYFGAGDFNADGVADSVWTTTDNYMSVMLTATNGQSSNAAYWFSKPGEGWSLQNIGDFNGDGRADTLWWNESLKGVADYITQDTFNTTGAPNAYGYWLGSPGSDWDFNGIADINNNNRMDVLFTNSEGAAAALIVDNSGSFASPQYIGMPGSGWNLLS